ncbi:adenylate/guanylate cyclase domain-containing protein [Robiginitalea sp. SC105]|uniref:adenylate/guanylate cyclase domain-containing protein n=1 Tax=Robiginitalea sp. SC105 TaxID=2762332 RepID=UPI001C8E2A99|nr:adenylate/guanylate cyclase domain-containing protein [Robiginitalea sp. SC105]
MAAPCYGQEIRATDSLESAFIYGDFQPADSLVILEELSYDIEDPEKKILYADWLIEVAKRQDSALWEMKGHRLRGNALRILGDYSEALEEYFRSAELAIVLDSDADLGTAYLTVADIYSLMKNTRNARRYYTRAIEILRNPSDQQDSVYLASALSNTGDEYYKQGKLDSALILFEESGQVFKALGYDLGIAYYLGSVGMVYSAQGKNEQALSKLMESLEILEAENDTYGIAAFLPFVSRTYLNTGNLDAALQYAKSSLEIGQQYNLKEQISEASFQLAEIHEARGNPSEALYHFKNYTIYKDSINNLGHVQQMARIRNDFEIARKQSEVDLLEKEALIQQLKEKRQKAVIIIGIGVLVVAFLVAYGLYRRYNYIKTTSAIIAREKSRSDALLRNILPEGTAEELKEYGKVRAQRFESVSVLFADFEGFTRHSENMSPEDLVMTVDYYFSEFDKITEQFGLEKIKTMGDCYMCAGGLPFPSEDHAVNIVRAALAFKEFVATVKQGPSLKMEGFDVRVGINSGPVVAGVVGTKKFAYDIWGDTVNIASRMESCSLPGRINLSEETYQLVRDHFDCEFRGMIHVKNKGMMKMYFISGDSAADQPASVAESAQTL